MLRRLLSLLVAAVTATTVLIACSTDAEADVATIEACERWRELRAEGPLDRASVATIVAIAEQATDPAVSQRAEAVAQRLELDVLGPAGAPERSARLDQACDAVLG